MKLRDHGREEMIVSLYNQWTVHKVVVYATVTSVKDDSDIHHIAMTYTKLFLQNFLRNVWQW